MRLEYSDNMINRTILPSINKTIESLNTLVNQSANLGNCPSKYAALKNYSASFEASNTKLKKIKNFIIDSSKAYNNLDDEEHSKINSISKIVINKREKIIS